MSLTKCNILNIIIIIGNKPNHIEKNIYTIKTLIIFNYYSMLTLVLVVCSLLLIENLIMIIKHIPNWVLQQKNSILHQ
jgi:hypothetical protein